MGVKKNTISLLAAVSFVSLVLLVPFISAAPPTYVLETEVSGGSGGSVYPESGTYRKNTKVSIEATILDPGWIFGHWEGDLSGSDNPTTIRMNSNKLATAVFVEGTTPPQYNLTTEVTAGEGSVVPSGGTYDENTIVDIQANADPGYHFDHWEGGLLGSENPTTITMNLDKHVIALFVPGGTEVDRAGLRASPYGISPFPPSSWWVDATKDMASRWSGAAPEVIWLVGEVIFPTSCQLSFPNPTPETTYPDILFKDQDEYESYFSAFDDAGVKVWMAVEPGNAEVSTLIDLTMTHYKHHPCIIGFAVDVEWYKYKSYRNGKAVTDAEAQAWSEQVRNDYNPSYLLCTKHWLQEKMPPTYRTAMMFLNDSQGFRNLSAMVNEFDAWGEYFHDGDVGFQYGYARDRKWWKKLSDKPGDIGNAILNNVSNTTDLFWVDFTAYDIWPEEFAMAKETSYDETCSEIGDSEILSKFALYQNYPNPFNHETVINYTIPEKSDVTIAIFNIMGKNVITLVQGQEEVGYHSVNWDAKDNFGSIVSAGIYFCKIQAGSDIKTIRMSLFR